VKNVSNPNIKRTKRKDHILYEINSFKLELYFINLKKEKLHVS